MASMIGFRINPWIRICWKYLTPLFCVVSSYDYSHHHNVKLLDLYVVLLLQFNWSFSLLIRTLEGCGTVFQLCCQSNYFSATFVKGMVSQLGASCNISPFDSIVYEIQWNPINPVTNRPPKSGRINGAAILKGFFLKHRKMMDLAFVWARIKWL